MTVKHSFLTDAGLDLAKLQAYQKKPAPFTPGEPLFWDDPHISKGMLAAHLNPDLDLASRKPETIDRSVAWISAALDLQPGDAVLDLGCGPGLYASRFAQRGYQVTGVDGSRRSIEYAREYARENDLDINYRYENYLTLTDEDQYEAVLLIYGDFCPLNPDQRSILLTNIHRALKPGGFFVLDVTTPLCHQRHGNTNGWYAAETGFWRPGPHLVLEDGFAYPDQDIYLDQMIVIEESGVTTVYRNWFQDYTPERITAELAEGDFEVQSLWNDLTGTPYQEGTEWIGVVAQRTEKKA
jgi:SAM-dependent methyltransferase